MKFSYEDLISGDSIPVPGVAHLRSPQLKELKPTQGIGVWRYNLYVSIMSWERDELKKFLRVTTGKRYNALDKAKDLSTFGIITLLDVAQALYCEVIGFFADENVEWDAEQKCFVTSDKNTNEPFGVINGENFDEVRDMILQLNYINLGQNARPSKFDTPQTKALWERVQGYLKQQSAQQPKDKKMTLGNIISKLCAVSIGYNLLNIYELTVFQLYDQFFQYGYLRATNLNDMIFSNHGGKNFDINEWLKPLF